MSIVKKLFAQSSDGPAVLKVDPWIVDSITPSEVMRRIVEESQTCRDCASPGGCQKHVEEYLEALVSCSASDL